MFPEAKSAEMTPNRVRFLYTSVSIQYDTEARQVVVCDASHGERRVIKATKPVLRYHEDGQLHFGSQIAHEIIGPNRHHPAAHTFDDDVLNSILKSAKSSKNLLDVEVHLFHKAAHNRRRRRLQPNGINFVDF